MFIDSFLKSLDRDRIPRPTDKRYITFKDYPLRELMEMLLSSTAEVYPHLPPKEGLTLLGRLVYPTLASTTVGKVMFSIAGRNFEDALPLSRKAYEISLKPGKAELLDRSPGKATLALRDVWNFADCYQVGVFQGAMESFQVEGTVRAKPLGRPCDVDLHLTWG